ncbi:response regulator [Aliiroseovarius sp. YM-037]|uniref:response regulator n=1 Tax=Aliiroseovarius sp. YM-037 TaxID=3341728 RepID=UPI003A808A8A
MSHSSDTADFATRIAGELPYLRRYARALTGSQRSGDQYALATLETMVNDPDGVNREVSPKVALFQGFHAIWISSGAPVENEEEGIRGRAQSLMNKLTTNTREALLLHVIEEFSYSDIAKIMQIDQGEVEEYILIAQRELADTISGKVLIIEDEAIIAMDLESIVSDMGHRITGVARTHQGAVDLGQKERPDLILADIQLADNSSGIDAVNDLLETLGDVPVIFITAFPERLLTGERPEPAFLISKPYTEEQVRLSVSQAMFFASTETLNV